jgi:hypothetical protein
MCEGVGVLYLLCLVEAFFIVSSLSIIRVQEFSTRQILHSEQCDKAYQLLAHGRWFSPGTPVSSTTKTGRHNIAESGVKHNKSIKFI